MTGPRLARQILARGSKSFAAAGALLPSDVLDDAAVVYAWCRRADDLIDLADHGQAAPAVAQLRAELELVYAGTLLGDPILAAFAETAARRRIPREYPLDLVEGMAMDAVTGPIVYASWTELWRYCYRVAGTVGLMMCHVMGVAEAPEPRARYLHAAAQLGMAMQLTNICRDVQEDWQRGRLYLPLVALGPGAETPVPGTAFSDELRARCIPAVRGLLDKAKHLYRAGERGTVALSFRCAVAVRAAGLVYASIGDLVARRGYDVAAPRAVVSGRRKLWLLVRSAVETGSARCWARLGRVFARSESPLGPIAIPQSVVRCDDVIATV